MTQIKAGTVAHIKTTEEPVFVLSISGVEEVEDIKLAYPQLAGYQVRVRRPVQGRDGVTHVVEYFYLEELETIEDKRTRQLAEMEEMKMRFSPHETMPSQGELFTTN